MGKLEKIIKKHQDGAIFDIFVTPDAHSIIFPAGFNIWRKCIEMKVCAAAKDDRANKEVIQTIANFFDKPLSDIYILAGRKNREKTIFIKDTSVDFVSDRLRGSLNGC
jgi:uncharacterized protein (TIGR00251 family)